MIELLKLHKKKTFYRVFSSTGRFLGSTWAFSKKQAASFIAVRLNFPRVKIGDFIDSAQVVELGEPEPIDLEREFEKTLADAIKNFRQPKDTK